MRPERGDDWLAELPGEVRNRLVQARSWADRLQVWYPSRTRRIAAGHMPYGEVVKPAPTGGGTRRLLTRS